MSVGTNDDRTTATITMTVKDAYALTADTSDDWVPTVSNSTAAAGIGAPLTVAASLAGLTTEDTRGTTSGNGILGGHWNALVGIKATGVGLAGGTHDVHRRHAERHHDHPVGGDRCHHGRRHADEHRRLRPQR